MSEPLRTLPLFPLRTVLFPGGRLPLKVFEQRYIDLAKGCIADDAPFGVCMITEGEEVLTAPGGEGVQFAGVGTLARIAHWDMPAVNGQLGILHILAAGGERFQVHAHRTEPSSLVVGEVSAIAPEPRVPLAESQRPMAKLVELVAARVGEAQFPAPVDYDDASWVGYRLAEFLPLPLSVKQHMLEINDARVRLTVLQKFLVDQKLIAG